MAYFGRSRTNRFQDNANVTPGPGFYDVKLQALDTVPSVRLDWKSKRFTETDKENVGNVELEKKPEKPSVHIAKSSLRHRRSTISGLKRIPLSHEKPKKGEGEEEDEEEERGGETDEEESVALDPISRLKKRLRKAHNSLEQQRVQILELQRQVQDKESAKEKCKKLELALISSQEKYSELEEQQKQTIQAHESQVEQLKQQSAERQRLFEEEQQKVLEKKNELNDLNHVIAESQKLLEQAEANRQTLLSSLEAEAKKSIELTAKVETLDAKIIAANEEFQRYQREVEERAESVKKEFGRMRSHYKEELELVAGDLAEVVFESRSREADYESERNATSDNIMREIRELRGKHEEEERRLQEELESTQKVLEQSETEWKQKEEDLSASMRRSTEISDCQISALQEDLNSLRIKMEDEKKQSERELAALSAELATEKEEREKEKSQHEELTAALKAKHNEEVEEKQKLLELSEENAKFLTQRLSEKVKEAECLDQRLLQVQKEVCEIQTLKVQAEDTLLQREKQMEALQCKERTLLDQVEEQRIQIYGMQEEICKLEEEGDQLKESLSQAVVQEIVEKSLYQSEKSDILQKLDNATHTLHSRDSQIQELSEAKAQLEKTVKTMGEDMEEQKSEFDRAVALLRESLEAKKAESKQTVSALKTQMDAVETNCKHLESERDALRQKITAVEETATSAMEEKRKEIKGLQEKYEQVASDLSESRQALKKSEEEAYNYQKALAQLEQSLAKLRKEVEEQEATRELIESQRDESLQEWITAITELDKVRKDYAALEMTINTIEMDLNFCRGALGEFWAKMKGGDAGEEFSEVDPVGVLLQQVLHAVSQHQEESVNQLLSLTAELALEQQRQRDQEEAKLALQVEKEKLEKTLQHLQGYGTRYETELLESRTELLAVTERLQSLKSQEETAIGEVERLMSMCADMAGHKNAKQKIKYIQYIRSQNSDFKQENKKLRDEIDKLHTQIKGMTTKV